MKRTRRNRYLLFFWAVIVLLICGYFGVFRHPLEQGTPSTPNNPPSPSSKNKIEKTAQNMQAPVEAIENPKIPFSQMKDAEAKKNLDQYQKNLVRSFNPFEKLKGSIVGTANIDYQGYQIHFRVFIQKWITYQSGKQAFPIYFERGVDAKAGVSTGATLDELSTTDDEIIFHLYTPLVADMLDVKNNPSLSEEMRKIVDELSDIMLAVDLDKTQTPITTRRYLDPNEAPLTIGTFSYKIE